MGLLGAALGLSNEEEALLKTFLKEKLPELATKLPEIEERLADTERKINRIYDTVTVIAMFLRKEDEPRWTECIEELKRRKLEKKG